MSSLFPLTDSISFAAETGKRLLTMQQTPADLRGYLSQDEGIALMLLAELGPGDGAVVEIGSFLGKSTCWLGLGAQAGKRGKITAVDYFKPLTHMAGSEDPMDQAIVREGSTFPTFKKHLEQFGVLDQVEPIQCDSETAASNWDGRPIRLLFIDGHHEYDSVKNDYTLWSPFVQKGGIIAFHDYTESWPGVIRFYDELMDSTQEYEELFTSHSMKVVVKKIIHLSACTTWLKRTFSVQQSRRIR